MINNCNIGVNSSEPQAQNKQCTGQHTQLVFANKEPKYVIEHSLRPRKDGTVMEILNNCNVVLRNVFDNTTTVIRQLNDEDIENYRNEERYSAENYDKAVKESEKLSLERKAHTVREP